MAFSALVTKELVEHYRLNYNLKRLNEILNCVFIRRKKMEAGRVLYMMVVVAVCGRFLLGLSSAFWGRRRAAW